MGNYLFTTRELVQEIVNDAGDAQSAHDFGKSIVTGMHTRKNVFVYNFATNVIPNQTERERGYWRDVGNLDAYFQANMDLVEVNPIFSLYNDHWPIYTLHSNAPPAKFVFNNEAEHRVGKATDSLISEGCIISGTSVNHSILGTGVRLNSYSRAGRLHRLREGDHRPPLPDPARHHRQARRDPGRHRHRLRPRGGPAPLPRHRERHRGHPQGDAGRAGPVGLGLRPPSTSST